MNGIGTNTKFSSPTIIISTGSVLLFVGSSSANCHMCSFEVNVGADAIRIQRSDKINVEAKPSPFVLPSKFELVSDTSNHIFRRLDIVIADCHKSVIPVVTFLTPLA
jgi:hypothetical protein